MTSAPTYIVAVSGGIDSVCLLHMLIHRDPHIAHSIPEDARLIVAHVDHGIRGERSELDAKFVAELNAEYGLTHESTALHLPPDSSEEMARDARYEFFEELIQKYHARGVILAHHQGDVIETAVLNTLRGTGRKGIASLKSAGNKVRPLLHLSKLELKEYAATHNLKWVEDATNQDPTYTRNRIRLALDRAEPGMKAEALNKIGEISQRNDLLEQEIANLLQYRFREIAILSRSMFVKLSHVVACEIVHAILTRLKVKNINRELVERVVVAIKVAKPGTKLDIDKDTVALVTKRSLRISDRETLKARRL